MIDFAGIVVGLVVVVFTYWLFEKRAKRKQEEEAAAARFAAAFAAVRTEFDRFRAASLGLNASMDGFVAGARLAFEKQARFSVTIYRLGASHLLTFDGTEPSRLAVLDLTLRRNPLAGRQ